MQKCLSHTAIHTAGLPTGLSSTLRGSDFGRLTDKQLHMSLVEVSAITPKPLLWLSCVPAASHSFRKKECWTQHNWELEPGQVLRFGQGWLKSLTATMLLEVLGITMRLKNFAKNLSLQIQSHLQFGHIKKAACALQAHHTVNEHYTVLHFISDHNHLI